jgi:hypothetical protein
MTVLLASCSPVTPDFDYVDSSDEMEYFAKAFSTAETRLLNAGLCSRSDFERGWFKSTAEMRRPTFLIYCDGYTTGHRIYLNVATGKLYRQT